MKRVASRSWGMMALVVAVGIGGAGTVRAAERSILVGVTQWKALGPVRDAERPRPTWYVDGPASADSKPLPAGTLFDAKATAGGAAFRLCGPVTEKRSMRWQCALPPQRADAQFFHLTYRAAGIAREHAAYPVIEVSGRNAQEARMAAVLLDCHSVVNDGRAHTYLGRLPKGLIADTATVCMASENSQAWLHLESLAFYSDRQALPAAAAVARPGQAPGARFVPLPLAANAPGGTAAGTATPFNDSITAAFDRVLEEHQAVVDGGRGCPAGRVAVEGVPFQMAAGAKNLLRPAERSAVNREEVEFLGAKVTRRNFFRPSRDDVVVVPLGGRRAAEVLFLLVCEMPAVATRYGLPSAPYRLDDIEAFAVELVYSDGTRDWAYPYSLADGGCVLARMFGAYLVPADASRGLEQIVFHNRLFGVTVSVAAVTLNAGARLAPALVDEPRPMVAPPPVPPAHRPAQLAYRDGQLMGGNSYYAFCIDCRQGFALRSLSNRWTPKTTWCVQPSSGLEVELAQQACTVEELNRLAGTAGQAQHVSVGKTVFTGRAFAVERVDVQGTRATIALESRHAALPLTLVVRLAVDDSPQWAMSLEATNRGVGALAATFRFPALTGLTIGAAADTWMFFPRYRALLSREPEFCVAANGPYFAHQFFDAFNPRAGSGLMTLTHNLEQLPVEYSLGKTAAGVCCGVAYPGQFHALGPGQTFRTAPTRLVFHAGDWHQALAEYQAWLGRWYRPRRVRGAWWRQAFVMRSHVISPDDSWQINHTPSIFDPVSRQYRIDEALAADRRYWGQAPDLVHFYGWYFRDREQSRGWGEYSTPTAYQQAGGLETLRRAVAHYQDDLHTPLSFYTLGDRCNAGTDAFARFGQEGALWRAGAPVPLMHTPEGTCRSMCWGYRPWQDHYVADLAKLQRDTGAKIIYLDVFPLQHGAACDCPTHGHETPLWFDRTSRQVLARLRDRLSQEVALYCEYPTTDVVSQDLDGNVAYYNLPLHRHFDKLYDVATPDERAAIEAETPFQLCRYVSPDIKQFCFAVGTEHGRSDSCLKIPFFNGDAEYGVTWRLNPERVRHITNRGLAIQKRYLDCFTSDRPQPAIATERRGVYANCFPGQQRTLWTLWNARYQTVRGPVLAVEHHAGDRYLDAWNDRPLEPQIRGHQAVLAVELAPQGLGCIVQLRQAPRAEATAR